MRFQVGNRVAWVSQAGGSVVEKYGVVAEVVAALALPSRERFERLYRSGGVGTSRSHQSYVVMVDSTMRVSGKRKLVTHRVPRPYWPIVAKLKAR